jgi:hypothetical protein
LNRKSYLHVLSIGLHARDIGLPGMVISLGWLPDRSSLRFPVGVQARKLEELVTRGWVRLAGHVDRDECAALAKPAALPWRPMAPTVGVVTQHGWFAQAPFRTAPAPVRALGARVHTAVSAALGHPLPDWNEVTWQRYEPGRGHIDPHRDQAYYKGLIVIVTLAGEAEFTIFGSRDPPVRLDRWTTRGGDLVLLRGADLGAAGVRGPLHGVGAPASDRFTVTLRHHERGSSRGAAH